MFSKSEELFNRAKQVIPGGVNSPVRAFKQVGGTPVFMQSAKGAYLYDADGNRYIDYINSWGPMILGHANDLVNAAIQEKIQHATSFGAPTELEVEMAELLVSMVPNVEMVRMVSSGTEACMTAIRLARGYTGRNKIIKFEGCYHGHSDALLVKAGSGVAGLGIQAVPGIPAHLAADTLTASFNNLDEIEALVKQYPNEIACLIIEPVAGNMGCVPPDAVFLEGLRELCTREGIVYIFDEVMTGFRLSVGGTAELMDVHPDLFTFGKVIGGGMPVGAIAGSKKIMEYLAPVGSVYQAGTLSGNPVAMIAGFTTLSYLKNNPNIYKELEEKTIKIKIGLEKIIEKYPIAATVNQIGSMISIHFCDWKIRNFADAARADNERFKRYFHFCLQHGIYLPPSPYETWFISMPLSDVDIDHTIAVTEAFFAMESGI
jgi:glutamate-1-semialdehyde 2,1-aminomutase